MVESLRTQLRAAEQRLQISDEILKEMKCPLDDPASIPTTTAGEYKGMTIGNAILDVLQTYGSTGLTVAEITKHLTNNGFEYQGNPNNFYPAAYSSTSHLVKQGRVIIGEKKGRKCFYPKVDLWAAINSFPTLLAPK